MTNGNSHYEVVAALVERDEYLSQIGADPVVELLTDLLRICHTFDDVQSRTITSYIESWVASGAKSWPEAEGTGDLSWMAPSDPTKDARKPEEAAE